jgi:hypothetical protein
VPTGVRIVAAQNTLPHAAVSALDDRHLGRVEDVRTSQAGNGDASPRALFSWEKRDAENSVLIDFNPSIVADRKFLPPRPVDVKDGYPPVATTLVSNEP